MMSDTYVRMVSLLIAGHIWVARELLHDHVKCCECRGTGAQNPDCKTCEGYRYPRLKRLHALGWENGDLEEIEDGYARCPSYGCEGEYCEFCEGGGRVPFIEQVQQERRALIFARYQRMPPLCTVDHVGHRRREYQLLSMEAATPIIESGDATRLQVLAFGDEFYLSDDSRYLELWSDARQRAKQAIAGRYTNSKDVSHDA